MAESEAQRRARQKYEARPEIRERKTGVYLKLNKETDADILEHLEAVGSKQSYIKELIRADIRAKKPF